MLAATSVKFEGKRAVLLEVRFLQSGDLWPGHIERIGKAGFWAGRWDSHEHIGKSWSDLMRWIRKQHVAGADVTIYSDRSTNHANP